MAKDKRKFAIAYQKWNELYEKRRFSVAPHFGKIAIICSFLTDYDGVLGGQKDIAEIEAFAAEAYALKAQAEENQRRAEVFEDATADTVKTVLRDEEISDIITIGHGALAYLYMPSERRRSSPLRFSERSYTEPNPVEQPGNRFDWFDVSQAATHLKTGSFTQRHCGHAVRELSVPLGLFAITDPSKVIVPLNTVFIPKSLEDTENDKLQPIIDEPMSGQLQYSEVKELFSKETYLEGICGDGDNES